MTEPSRPPFATVHDLGFSHGPIRALRNVTLSFHPGRHYIVAGPNGAGKSTLLDLLCNLKRPREGSVRIDGRAPAVYAPGRLAQLVALAPQEYHLDFSFTIREIVAMGRRPYLDRWGRLAKEDRDAVEQALCDMHLDAIADKSVMALSGGEKRRSIVARALAQTTPMLLLDEPTAGLDVAQALSVMAHAQRMAETGSLVVTVSHDLNLAARFGHECIFLKNGTLAANGPIAAVFTDEVLSKVYDADARVSCDEFTGAPAVSFNIQDNGPGAL